MKEWKGCQVSKKNNLELKKTNKQTNKQTNKKLSTSLKCVSWTFQVKNILLECWMHKKYLDKSLVMSIFCSKCFYVSLQVFWRTKNLFKPFIIFNSLLNVIIIIAKIIFFLLITIYLSHYAVLLYYISSD